ncbi:MAG: GNAT family N-acetyltransferase [Candidatus Yanofskybacteria bacterium]|nr:GNAT family N-acetyltransferase [Candidatus Yanofskybacteria bacterium]
MDLNKELKSYLNSKSQITAWPSKIKNQLQVLLYLSNKFDWAKNYTEKEVNELLEKYHTFKDPALLRRELYEKGFLDREANGNNYWKKGNQIPTSWESERLFVKDAKKEEIDDLQKIYDNCGYIGQWTGLDSKEDEPILTEFEHKNLPPQGIKELHRFQAIHLKKDEKIVGYFVFYHGFPEETSFWIAILAIHTDFQKNKFGQEVIEQLTKEVKKLGVYQNIGLSVGIKNWPALRFWINTGFNEIIKFTGDNVYNEKAFADLWLSQKLG